LTAGGQNGPAPVAVDLRVKPRPVISTDGLQAQTANQHMNDHSHGLVPGSAGVAAFSSSPRPMPGEAFVELPSSMSGPTLWRFRYIIRLGKLNVTRCRARNRRPI